MGSSRAFLAVLLALLLAAASVPLALGRAAAPSVARVVLCAEGGERTLALDAAGRPLPGGGLFCPGGCPDCLPPVPALAAAAAPLPARPTGRARPARPLHARGAPGRRPRRPRTRAPPVAG